MAVYNGSMSIRGTDNYGGGGLETSYGWQIGGSHNGGCGMVASITLPETYAAYNSCVLEASCYATDYPWNWQSNWSMYIEVRHNGSTPIYGNITGSEATGYFNGSGYSCSFTLNLDNFSAPTFKPRDVIEVEFQGAANSFINASGNCLYVDSFRFISNDATPASTRKYLYVQTYIAASVNSSTRGTYYVTREDYLRYWGPYWGTGIYAEVYLDGYGGNYIAGVTYYRPGLSPLTHNNSKLFIP